VYLHPGPFFVVERILVFALWIAMQYRGDAERLSIISLEWFHGAGPLDADRCEAAQANRWLKCQPSSYVRLEAYGFFGLSEGA
jgi:hypothetical protein